MQPPVAELDGDEVGGLSRVEHEEAVLLEGPELELDVDGVVGFHLRQPDVRVLRGEADRVVHGRVVVGLHQDGVQLVVGQLAAGGQLEELLTVHDKLLNGTWTRENTS